MPDASPLLTKRAAAAYYGLSVRTLDRRIAAGDLPAVRVGPRAVRIRRADLDALLRNAAVAR